MEPTLSLGAVLRLKRNEEGLSLRTLAKMAEVSPAFISNIERGISLPSIGTLDKLAKGLGCTAGDLLDGRGV